MFSAVCEAPVQHTPLWRDDGEATSLPTVRSKPLWVYIPAQILYEHERQRSLKICGWLIVWTAATAQLSCNILKKWGGFYDYFTNAAQTVCCMINTFLACNVMCFSSFHFTSFSFLVRMILYYILICKSSELIEGVLFSSFFLTVIIDTF